MMNGRWGYSAVERGGTYSSWELQYHIRKNSASMRSRAAHSLSLFIQTTYLQIYPPLHYLRTTLVELLSASLPSPSTSTPEVHNECLTHSKKHSVQTLSQELSRRFSFTTFSGNIYVKLSPLILCLLLIFLLNSITKKQLFTKCEQSHSSPFHLITRR